MRGNLLKGLAALTAVILILLLPLTLTGCSGDDDEPEFLPGSPTVYKELEPAAISFAFPGVQPKNWPDVKAEIERQIKDTINAAVDFKWFDYQTYMQNIRTAFASQQPPDVLCCGQPEQYYPDFTKLAREGLIKDITDIFPKSAPGLFQKYGKQELVRKFQRQPTTGRKYTWNLKGHY